MPAFRRYRLSLAPVAINGITGTPGQNSFVTFSIGPMTAASSGEGGLGFGRSIHVTSIPGSFRTFISVPRTSSAEAAGSTRHRAVAASVVRREPKRDINLLARADTVVEPLSVLESPAAALVEREGSIDQVAMLRKKPGDAVVVAGFLVGGQRDDQIAFRYPTFFFVANQIGDENRRHRLVIARPAAVVVAILFEECEWIDRP